MKKSASSLQFIDYKKFETEFRSNPDLNVLSRFDFESILLLDSTLADGIYKFDTELRRNVYDASLACKSNKYPVGFHTYLQTLRAVLADQSGRDMILRCTTSEDQWQTYHKITGPVYINGNVAVIAIESEAS